MITKSSERLCTQYLREDVCEILGTRHMAGFKHFLVPESSHPLLSGIDMLEFGLEGSTTVAGGFKNGDRS